MALYTPQRVLYFSGERPTETAKWKKVLKRVATPGAMRPLVGVLLKRAEKTMLFKERYCVLFGMTLQWHEWKGGNYLGHIRLECVCARTRRSYHCVVDEVALCPAERRT